MIGAVREWQGEAVADDEGNCDQATIDLDKVALTENPTQALHRNTHWVPTVRRLDDESWEGVIEGQSGATNKYTYNRSIIDLEGKCLRKTYQNW